MTTVRTTGLEFGNEWQMSRCADEAVSTLRGPGDDNSVMRRGHSDDLGELFEDGIFASNIRQEFG